MADEALRLICEAWFGRRHVALRPLTSGYSGASVHVVQPEGSAEQFVLKQFRSRVSLHQARWLHDLVRHIRTHGISQIPEAIPLGFSDNPAAASIAVDAGGRAWELARFVPGLSTDRPTTAQAVETVETLARIHRITESFPGPFDMLQCSMTVGMQQSPQPEAHRVRRPSPAMIYRIERAKQLLAAPWESRRAKLETTPARDVESGSAADVRRLFLERFDSAIEIFGQAGGTQSLGCVTKVERIPLPLQAVLIDVWRENVLFSPSGGLSGIVDLHSAGIETPALDLARLLGSWHRADQDGRNDVESLPKRWEDVLAAYERIRPLTADERYAVTFFGVTSAIHGLDNWFRWVIEDQLAFAPPEHAMARIDELLSDLPLSLQAVADLLR